MLILKFIKLAGKVRLRINSTVFEQLPMSVGKLRVSNVEQLSVFYFLVKLVKTVKLKFYYPQNIYVFYFTMLLH